MNYKLYILYCPYQNIIRYIGVTKRDLKDRLTEHLRCDKNKHKSNWIKKILSKGYIPEIKLIADNLSEEKAYEMEKQLIKICRHLLGKKLTNINDGGKHIFNCSNSKSVVQIEPTTGMILNLYYSINEAARKNNISDRSIRKVLKGKRKTAGGSKWKFLSDLRRY